MLDSALATPVALHSLDLCAPAREAGWRHAEAVRPDEMLCPGAILHLASQRIPVRLVVNTGVDAAPLLERLRFDIQHDFFFEQYVVMAGFGMEAIAAFKKCCQALRTRRVHVGSPQAYLSWLQARLGPLGALPVTSPVRALTEHMLCVTASPEPLQKRDPAGSYEGSAIKPSFDLGQLGVQAVETLFAHTRGDHNVVNVEGDPAWRTQDVDLLIRESGLGNRLLRVEVKNEDKTTGNIVLEKYSCYERKTTGWFEYSTADVLVSCLWPTGDALIMDFAAMREWVRTTPRSLRLVLGTVPEQNYHSQVLLASIKHVLADVPGAIHVRLGDWLPRLYRGAFAERCLVPGWLKHKTLQPQRLALLG